MTDTLKTSSSPTCLTSSVCCLPVSHANDGCAGIGQARDLEAEPGVEGRVFYDELSYGKGRPTPSLFPTAGFLVEEKTKVFPSVTCAESWDSQGGSPGEPTLEKEQSRSHARYEPRIPLALSQMGLSPCLS